MKTLYEVLEVSENASNEIIEKAYKVLAKKYHPDLQTAENKAQAENKMKEINEAYDVLSDEQKRRAYDDELANKREAEKQKNHINRPDYYANAQNTQYNYQNNMRSNYQKNTRDQYNKVDDMQRRRYEEQLRKQEEKMRKQMQERMQQDYENAYYGYLRSLGYKIKERWTWKKTKELMIALAILVVIFVILWFLPPTHKMLVDFYESNKVVKILVDIVVNLFRALFEAISSMFTGGK